MLPPCAPPDASSVEELLSVIAPAVMAIVPPAPASLLASMRPLRLARPSIARLIEPPSFCVADASIVPPSERLDAEIDIAPPPVSSLPVASITASRSIVTPLSADKIIRPFSEMAERACTSPPIFTD